MIKKSSHSPQYPSTLIDLIRHGEPAGGDKYRGSLDDPLSPTGWGQMRGAVGDHNPWDSLITSPLLRCREFAQEVSHKHALPLKIDPRFQEMSFGDWEGKTGEELMERDRERLTRFWKNPLDNPPPGGEHLLDLEKRVGAAWEEMIQDNLDKHLLLVAHGGVIRMILSLVMATPLIHLSRWTVPYAGLTRIRVDQVEETTMPRLIFHCGAL
ncbi:MAG: alpha-ribazole phosphatase family protein [Magnetococcales bacterium]|nr:alpha-ribazole phosphatase family protein [Magnetococcales bacterium]